MSRPPKEPKTRSDLRVTDINLSDFNKLSEHAKCIVKDEVSKGGLPPNAKYNIHAPSAWEDAAKAQAKTNALSKEAGLPPPFKCVP